MEETFNKPLSAWSGGDMLIAVFIALVFLSAALLIAALLYRPTE